MSMKNVLLTVGCCLGVLGTPALAKGDPIAGEQKAQACAACHGPHGDADDPQFPRLAGQYESYLLHALREYKSGERQNPIMAGMVAGLNDQDLQDLAAFYARQEGRLQVVP